MNKMIISPRFVRYLVLRPSFLRGSRRPWRSLPVFCLSNDAYMSLARPRRRLNTSQRKAGVVKCQWKGEKHGTFADFCVYIYILYTHMHEVSLVVLISCSSFFVLQCPIETDTNLGRLQLLGPLHPWCPSSWHSWPPYRWLNGSMVYLKRSRCPRHVMMVSFSWMEGQRGERQPRSCCWRQCRKISVP